MMFVLRFILLNIFIFCVIDITLTSTVSRNLLRVNNTSNYGVRTRKLQRRNAINPRGTKWPKKTVIYYLDPSLHEYESNVENAIKEIEAKSCVRFQKKSDESSYVKIFSGKGCSADIGYENRGEQFVSLKAPDCLCHGVILHELMHTLGFLHMHSRSDRDKHIKIHWENVNQTERGRFLRLRQHQNHILTPFDFDSVMLYGNTTYSKDKVSITISSLNGVKVIDVCEKLGLSYYDVLAVNKLYEC